MRFVHIMILSLALLSFAHAASGQRRQHCSVLRAHDSCRVELASGKIVRLLGLQLFANNQSHLIGPQAFLDSLVSANSLWLELDNRPPDASSRIFGYLWRDSLLINEELLRRGLVQLWTDTAKFQYREIFLAAEREAREARRGNWGFLPTPLDTALVTMAGLDDTVYVTKTGRKYHYANCRLLSANKMALPLSKARMKYGPCRLCAVSAAKADEKNPRLQREKIAASRCAANTKSGARCKRQAEPGSKYCWQHRRQ
jgi:endonuclease YncB( thermonuclease family)